MSCKGPHPRCCDLGLRGVVASRLSKCVAHSLKHVFRDGLLWHDVTFFNVFVYCGTIMFKCVRYIFIHDIKFCYSVIWVSLPFLSFSVADIGEGPRGATPLILRANGGLKGRTNLFLETAPPRRRPSFLKV